MNIERKILTHYEIIDHMPEQTESAITQVNKESKLWVHPNLKLTSFSLNFSFKFTYICIPDIWTLKGNFVKENKKSFNFIKTTTKQKFITNLHSREALRKLHMQLVIPVAWDMGQKTLTYKATMHKLNSMFFYQLALPSNNHNVVEKHWKMKRKKTEECNESQSQITAINIFGFTFYIKN